MSKKKIFFKKIVYVIPSALLPCLPDYCHSFRIFVILSGFLSFLPICHAFRIIAFQIFVILNSSSTLPYPKGEKIGRQSRPYLRVYSKRINFSWNRSILCQKLFQPNVYPISRKGETREENSIVFHKKRSEGKVTFLFLLGFTEYLSIF